MLSITITLPEFKGMLKQAVRVEVEIIKRAYLKNQNVDILSRKRAAQLLEIDLSTLHQWTKDKLIQSYRIGGRVYYKKSELDKALIPAS